MPTTSITYQRLRFRDMIIDPRVQRPEDTKKLKDMVDHFDPEALGQITCSEREDGTIVLLDGQHRGKASALVGFDEDLDVKIYHGLTLAEEARLFRLLNNTTKASRIALFNVAVTEGDPVTVQVNNILREYGLKAGHGSFSAVGTALNIARRDNGVENFRWALSQAVMAWGLKSDSLDGRVIQALAMFRARYGYQIDSEAFSKKLAGVPGGVDGILGRARTYQQVKGGRIQANIAATFVAIYNAYMKKNKLEEWSA